MMSGCAAAHSSAFSAVSSFVEPSSTMMISMSRPPPRMDSMQASMYAAEL